MWLNFRTKIITIMSFTSGSSSSYNNNLSTLCYCNIKARMSAARTAANYGKRFVGCANYRTTRRCNFFAWIGEQFDPEEFTIIHKLLNHKTELQERVKQLEEDLKAKDLVLEKKTQSSSIVDIMLVGVVVIGLLLFQFLV